MKSQAKVFSKYALSLLRLKVGEFVACALLGSALIFLVPGTYYGEPGVLGALRGGVIFAGLFFLFTLYPIISVALIFAAVALRLRSRTLLSSISSVFLLAYTAWWASMIGGGPEIGFWITWLVMGVATFVLAMWLLPNDETAKEVST